MRADDPRHGKYAGARKHWVDGETPCLFCRRAAANYQSFRELDAERGNPRSVDSIRASRRIRALVASGWSLTSLAPHFGVTPPQVHKWSRGGAFVRASTLARIVQVYDRLETTPPPCATSKERRAITYALTVARRNGWVEPRAWWGGDIDNPDEQPDPGYQPHRSHHDKTIDPVVVDRVLAGDFTLARSTTKAEKVAIVAGWRDSGRSLTQLEKATGWQAYRYYEDGAA